MNKWTKISIELANKSDYLDQLFAVYPTIPDEKRKIKSEIIEEINKHYHSRNNIKLFSILIKLELFPIKDSYVAFLKRNLPRVSLRSGEALDTSLTGRATLPPCLLYLAILRDVL